MHFMTVSMIGSKRKSRTFLSFKMRDNALDSLGRCAAPTRPALQYTRDGRH
jgi:hypothetical protein